MPNYNGQESCERSTYDGERIFTEAHRKLAYGVLNTGIPNPELSAELRLLANQKPYPSHQAAFLLDRMVERGLALVPDFDTIMGNAWGVDAAGFPHLTRLDLASVGISYETEGDGR